MEKKIVLKQNKGDYQIERVKKKVWKSFKKLGTKDFDIKMNDGSSIQNDRDIILYLLGQQEPLPKCSVFVGIPRFDSADLESISKSSDNHLSLYHDRPQLQLMHHNHNHSHSHVHHNNNNNNNGLHNNSPISPLPISFDLGPPILNKHDSNKSSNQSHHSHSHHSHHQRHHSHHSQNSHHTLSNNNNNNDDDDININDNGHGRINNNISDLDELNNLNLYQGHREYICCFNNILMKLQLTMYDISQYCHQQFINKFLKLFDYKLKLNESLQFKVYHISTKQYIAIKLPLWSYDSQHYHIEGQIIYPSHKNKNKQNRSCDKNENHQHSSFVHC